MSNLIDELRRSIADGLTDRSLTSCSRWAANRRVMGEPFPGPYSWTYHPWVRQMHDSSASFNYAMKSAQAGVTEVAINRALYVLDRLRRDVLYVLPTSLNASDFSKARFATALALSPKLAAIFTDTNTVNLKQAGANTLYIRGSRGDSNLKSIPVSELFLDEVDEMDQKQIWLALERLSGQVHKHVWGISTPTIPNYGIHKLYMASTQEHFVFKCPYCSRWSELVWPDCVEIIGEHVADVRCGQSFLKCKECQGRLVHETKPDWLATGTWKVTAKNANPDIRGFHINQLYSFTVTPGELVVAYFRGFGDELANKEFHNSKLGLPFIGDGAKITDEDVDACIKNHTKDAPRPQVGGQRIITMGCDQGRWNYVEVTEWFFDRYSTDLNVAARAKVLYEFKFHEEEWHLLDALMVEWQVMACVLDADPGINEARRFCRRFPGYAYLCRYRRGITAKEIQIQDDGDYAPIVTVDRTNWMSASLGRFRQPRRIELPRDVSMEYRQHIEAPVRTYVRGDDRNPRAVFVETGPDHFAHARTYSEIALPFAASHKTGEDIKKFL